MSQSQHHVFHLVPQQLQGNTLYPLNRLQEIAPDIARQIAKKYAGRESVRERYIPPLDCLWNDVLMFCPVHPSQIMQTFREEGFDLKARRWFKIPLSRLELQNAAVYFSRNQAFGDHSIDGNDFVSLAQSNFDSLTRLPEALRKHIQIARSENRSPFMFVGVPHILYKGALQIEGIEIVAY